MVVPMRLARTIRLRGLRGRLVDPSWVAEIDIDGAPKQAVRGSDVGLRVDQTNASEGEAVACGNSSTLRLCPPTFEIGGQFRVRHEYSMRRMPAEIRLPMLNP